MLLGIYSALAAALTPPPATAALSAPVLSRLAAGVPRSDETLASAVKTMLAEAPAPTVVDFGQTAGTWRVVNAPHIDTLSKLALTTFDPIEYRMTPRGDIASYVRYDSRIFGSGYLCTDGTIENVAEADKPTVRIIWDRIWWQPGGEAGKPPVNPEAEGSAFLRPLVQALGRAGFIEAFSVFPVRYVDVDSGLAVFDFSVFSVTTRRV